MFSKSHRYLAIIIDISKCLKIYVLRQMVPHRKAHFQAELYNEKTSDREIILNAMGVYTRYSGCQMYSFLYSLC